MSTHPHTGLFALPLPRSFHGRTAATHTAHALTSLVACRSVYAVTHTAHTLTSLVACLSVCSTHRAHTDLFDRLSVCLCCVTHTAHTLDLFDYACLACLVCFPPFLFWCFPPGAGHHVHAVRHGVGAAAEGGGAPGAAVAHHPASGAPPGPPGLAPARVRPHARAPDGHEPRESQQNVEKNTNEVNRFTYVPDILLSMYVHTQLKLVSV